MSHFQYSLDFPIFQKIQTVDVLCIVTNPLCACQRVTPLTALLINLFASFSFRI